MRITRAHEHSQIIITAHPPRHRITRRPAASPDGDTSGSKDVSPRPGTGSIPGTGPAAFLAAHPWAYFLSLAGSSAGAVYGFTTARQDARHRVLRLALGAHCAAQSAGIVIATERARQSRPARRRTSGDN